MGRRENRPGSIGIRIVCDTADAATQVGVQAKGGSRDVTIRRCRFDEVGDRGVNIGGNTEFARNVWLWTDAPSRTRELVRTPVAESDGVYGKDPKFTAPEKGDVTLRPGSPAAKAGAGAFRE